MWSVSAPVGAEQRGGVPASPDHVSRRSLLRATALGGATIAVAGTAGLSYRVFDTGVLDPGGGAAFDAWRTWQDHDGPLGAVAAAILAANPHNSQPWLFGVSPTSIDVYADLDRRTGTLDPLQRELHVGLGCALENLLIAAEARGLAPTLQSLPDGATGLRVARVTLGRGAADPTALYRAIGDRHTNRGPFETRAVPESTLAELGDATGIEGVAVSWITDSAARGELGRLMVDAATAITSDLEQSRDSFAWFRPDDDAVQEHRDGLTLDGQGFGAAKLAIAKLLPATSRADGDRFWVDQTRAVHTATAAAYGVLMVGDASDVRSRLAGGRLLQRIHLRATSRGIALQHMNQVTERIDRERVAGDDAGFAGRFAAILSSVEEPLAAFRVGYPVRDARPSPRRALREVIR
jgi:hypothetical protein